MISALTKEDLEQLTQFRRHLHQHPEISGEEAWTAEQITKALAKLSPSQVLTGLGGHGVAAIFDSGTYGPTVLFRAELDALPIQEISGKQWASTIPGKGHLCGHDGHMTMLLAFGQLLKERPTSSGRVVLMFQPSEEDGRGARAVVADPQYPQIQPDWAFAIHNEPGRPFGHVSTRPGLINCASQGLQIKLTGKTAHAANPEDGISPANAVAQSIPALQELGKGGELDENFKLATVTHVQIGEPTFGVAPSDAVINVTLRSTSDAIQAKMVEAARDIVVKVANKYMLQVTCTDCDVFAATVNNADAVDIAVSALNALGIPNSEDGLPMRASEDFGVFGWAAKAAMLCLGPGIIYPALHNPDYDFPDELIPIGASIFERIVRELLG